MKPEAPELREIATTGDGRDVTRGFVSPLMPLTSQDSVLGSQGGSLDIYREVLRDDQVASTWQQRRLAVVSREWEVRAGGESAQDEAAAVFLRQQLERIAWDSVTDKMLFGTFYGYAVAECLWARDGKHVVLQAIKVRDRRRFQFDGAMRLRLRTSDDHLGELVPERKFWSYSTGADHDDEPYGLGLAHWLYWPVFFKRSGMKFWLIFLDKFGGPSAVGKYPVHATPEEQKRLLSAVEQIMLDSGVVIPEGMLIELLEAKRSGTADYHRLIEAMDKAIAKVVLGQTMTSDAEGGQYKAEVHLAVRDELVKADADLICQSFNQGPARWLTEWNFPGAALPQVWRKLEEAEDRSALASTWQAVKDVGYRPTLAQVEEDLGGKWEAMPGMSTSEETKPRLPEAPAAAAFAEGEDLAVQQAAQLARESAPAMDAMVTRIEQLVEEVATLEELRDRLIELGDMSAEELAKVMGVALVAAAAGGRYDIIEEAGGAAGG